MNQKSVSVSAFAIAYVLASSCLCSVNAQQPLAQDVAPSAVPQRIFITMEVVDVPADVIAKLDRSTPEGSQKAAAILDALTKDQATELVSVMLQTPNDFPGVATYDKKVSFTDKTNAGKGFVDLVTSLEATPHLEANDFIRINLKTTTTKISPDGLPNSIQQVRTLPVYHFKNGETAMFCASPMNPVGKLVGPADSQAWEQVSFITASVLPASDKATLAK